MNIDGRMCNIAILAADGFSAADVAEARGALGRSAHVLVVATHLGVLDGDDGSQLPVDVRLLRVSASDFDGVFIPGGDAHVDALAKEPQAAQFLSSAIGRGRVVAAAGSGRLLLSMIRGDGSTGSGRANEDGAPATARAMRLIIDDGGGEAFEVVRRFTEELFRPQGQLEFEASPQRENGHPLIPAL